MCPSRSKWLRTGPNRTEKFKKPAKTSINVLLGRIRPSKKYMNVLLGRIRPSKTFMYFLLGRIRPSKTFIEVFAGFLNFSVLFGPVRSHLDLLGHISICY